MGKIRLVLTADIEKTLRNAFVQGRDGKAVQLRVSQIQCFRSLPYASIADLKVEARSGEISRTASYHEEPRESCGPPAPLPPPWLEVGKPRSKNYAALGPATILKFLSH